jgi:hypothetical protein
VGEIEREKKKKRDSERRRNKKRESRETADIKSKTYNANNKTKLFYYKKVYHKVFSYTLRDYCCIKTCHPFNSTHWQSYSHVTNAPSTYLPLLWWVC